MSEIERRMVMDDTALKSLVARALDGNDRALEALVRAIQDPIFGLALRMLGSEADARDATQDILIRVVTRLSSFRGDSKFMTWAYRIASNALIDVHRGRRETVSFESLADTLTQGGPSSSISARPDHDLLVEETFLGCSLAMLRCLDRGHRLAFILGAILDLPGDDGAAILGISPATFRKRLQRARTRLDTFMSEHCGVINDDARCRCEHQVAGNIERKRIDPERLRLAVHHGDLHAARNLVRSIGRVASAVELYRRHPHYFAPDDFSGALRLALANQIEPV